MNCTQDLYYCLSSSTIVFSDLLGAVWLLNFSWRLAPGFSAFGFITSKQFLNFFLDTFVWTLIPGTVQPKTTQTNQTTENQKTVKNTNNQPKTRRKTNQNKPETAKNNQKPTKPNANNKRRHQKDGMCALRSSICKKHNCPSLVQTQLSRPRD